MCERPSPRVLNKRTAGVPRGAVYVGRPAKWGNPFVIGRDGTREEVIERYRRWIKEGDGRRLLVHVGELRDRDLVCWCAPRRCHAEVLLELANVPGPGL
jgi:hypothetical protein